MPMTHAQRQKVLEEIEQKSIVGVAESLGITLVRQGQSYTWSEHDSFVLTPKKNAFYWNSRQVGGGSIKLVQVIKECTHAEALQYLQTVEAGAVETLKEPTPTNFHYYMKEHTQQNATIDYLLQERKLSRETIDFFFEQNLMAQSTYTDKETGQSEPVIVFKHVGLEEKIKGVALQGIWENKKLHGERGRLKRVWGNGYYGLTVRVGYPPKIAEATSEKPIKIIVFEAPIDLMSYYELKKETIGDAVLFCANGLKKGAVSTLIANEIGSYVKEEEKPTVLEQLEKSKLTTEKVQLVLAVDNDEAGKKFIQQFSNSWCPITLDQPKLIEGKSKTDWNDILKQTKNEIKKKEAKLKRQEAKKRSRERNKEMSEKTQMKQKSQPELTLEEIIKKKDYQKLSQHLNDGIKEYLTSDTFKNYLDFASKFHKYSSKNIRLLLAQNPNIRRVAGYNAWKKLDRQVKKGSKALYVYAPYFKDKVDKNGKKVTDENGEIVKETRYFLTPVFDVEQTTGAELPQLVYNLEENLSDGKTFTRTYNALVEICPVPVTVTSIASGANGYYDPTKKEIVLQQHLGEVMTLKVLLHEMTHAMLHPDSQAIFGDDVYSRQEFEAESVAYIVSRHLGLDTSSYSFGYLSSWTRQGEKLEEFTQSLETITKEARTLIEKADHALSIEKGIQLPQNKFEERLLNAKKKETEVGKSQANEQKRQQNEPKISAQIANPTRF
ncbi:ArdC-like ssDNA-binding domain-containing protein [Enterococcus faecalis]|uniref:ArdC-like ssDNA-binding domain-containing protein n=2 Tax=Enterococcus faecalis TaxID=1351 RepID=UPI0035CBF7D1